MSSKSNSPRGPIGAWLLNNVATVAMALLIALILKTLIFQPFTIPSSSMEPTLRTGDYLIVSKFAYGWSRHSIQLSPPIFQGRILGKAPRRGDVIVFKLPRDGGKTDYVKRLVGLPGDHVQVKHSTVYINDKALKREVQSVAWDPESPGRKVTAIRETNPEGRSYSIYQETPDHDGENTQVYTVPQGQYFFMGDNRDNSLDSRWPGDIGVGFVPSEDLVGRVEIVLASWQEGVSLFKPWTWATKLDVRRLLHLVR